MNVRLTEEQKIKILNADDLYKVMQQVLLRENKIDRNKEHFWIVCLATNNQILLIELISLGTVNQTLVEPMEVFSFALQKRAVKIIMVHNHPSGELSPSDIDIELTDKMQAIGKFINVPVIDHLIITEKSYYSFAEKGLLAKIMQDSEYDLTFSQIELLKKQLDKAELRKAKEMAKKMLDKKYAIEEIAEITGLSKEQIERL
ncbi:DNA repair protein RadC [Fulvivirga imtechensis AK7]|uniref:DNA repair protein RadC n=1 Tax=Fulvivirga imtechensis AK7 TaxID=1237149 RepID=L8JXH7_9BACT|nr:JAB domain-containing protein [Fulvivirga imtechensis]ELR72888.1 DNA repair protein RadC [Fulvivirga imtechensis AK7]